MITLNRSIQRRGFDVAFFQIEDLVVVASVLRSYFADAFGCGAYGSARALVVPKKYRSCEVCGKVMEISTDPHSPLAKRADALICGDRCRSQKSRDKRKTIRLRREGFAWSRIQEDISGRYSPTTLKQWVLEAR
jgi:hypothetical protein